MGGKDRIIKGALSVLLILGGAGFYTRSLFRVSSEYAMVAAPSFEIHAPRDGKVTHAARTFSVLRAGAKVTTLSVVPTDDPDLRVALAELETARADVASLKRLIDLGADMGQKTRVRESALGVRRVELLERTLQQASANMATKKAELEGADLAKERAEALCGAQLMATQECEAVRTKAQVAGREYESSVEQSNVARFLLESSRSGVDVGQDIGSEATYARQHRDELQLRIATLRQQLETREAETRALEFRVAPPPIDITVSSNTRIWTMFRQSGSLVAKGEPLFQAADCDQLFVFATVLNEKYEELHVGQNANVTFKGRSYSGKVAQLSGPSGTLSQSRGMLPEAPPFQEPRQPLSAAVAIEVPTLARELRGSCEIGTAVEVEFVKH